MQQFFKKFDKGIGYVEDAVTTAALGVIVVLVVAEVFARYVLNSGILWGDEVIVNLMVLMVMFGAPAAIRRFLHTDLQVFVNMMPKPVRITVKALTCLIGLAFLGLFLYSSTTYTFAAWGSFTTVLKIPMPYIYVMMLVGAVLMVYEYLKAISAILREEKKTLHQ